MKPGLDIAAATFIILGASVTGWASFGHISQLEQAQHSMSVDITPGSYSIRQAGLCVGSLETNLHQGVTIRSNFNLHLRVAAAHTPKVVEARGDASFNPLGQLVAGHFEIKSDDTRIQIASANANPIELAVAVRTLNENFKHNFSIPGPISIRQKSDQQFELHFPKINASLGSFTPLFSSMVSNAPLRLIPATENTGCDQTNEGALEVGMGNSQLQQLMQRVFEGSQ